jgi:hypothetical protein
MRELAWYMQAGGFLMYPILLLTLLSVPVAVVVPVVAAIVKKRVCSLVLGLVLLTGGALILGMGVAGFYIQLGMVEDAVANLALKDAQAIRFAGLAESRVCLIAGIAGALPAIAGAASALALASRKLAGMRARPFVVIALPVLVLGLGAMVVVSQAGKHVEERQLGAKVLGD